MNRYPENAAEAVAEAVTDPVWLTAGVPELPGLGVGAAFAGLSFPSIPFAALGNPVAKLVTALSKPSFFLLKSFFAPLITDEELVCVIFIKSSFQI